MDIYITDKEGRKYLIELKVPRENCGAPKEMFHAIDDQVCRGTSLKWFYILLLHFDNRKIIILVSPTS
jgi:hypothetical protein